MAWFKKSADAGRKSSKETARPKRRVPLPKFVRGIGAYFKGAWHELRQTKWPTRKATWSLTGAVIAFTAMTMVFIVAVDYVFDELFQRLVL